MKMDVAVNKIKENNISVNILSLCIFVTGGSQEQLSLEGREFSECLCIPRSLHKEMGDRQGSNPGPLLY